MKKVFAFAAFAILLASCNNVGKYKPMIEELSTNWDAATSTVTDFSGKVTAAQSEMVNMNSQLSVSPDVMESWGDDVKAQFGDISSSAKANMANLTNINNEVNAFVNNWQEKGAELKALKDGLEAGKLEGDVQAKISSLSDAAANATTKVADWQARLNEVTAATAKAKQSLASFMETNGIENMTSGTK